jgi:hypothetical protein
LNKPAPTFFAASVIAAALCACVASPARAQDWVGMMTWQMSLPIGETQEFVDEVSFRGMGLDFRKRLRGGTFASVEMAWNVFHQRSDELFEFDSGAVSGSQDHYINAFPIMIGVHQYFGKPRSTRMHVGLNVGGYLFVQTLRIGVTEFEEDTWEWGVAPEAGVAIPIQTGLWFEINARYHWSPTPETLLGRDTELTYYQFNLGFMWEQ